MIIACDTREQKPLPFATLRGVDTEFYKLDAGDYSIKGYETAITFERKSIPDLVGTLIRGHERFLRELERMQNYDEKYLLIEHNPITLYDYCFQHGWQGKVNTIFGSLLAYACHYHLRIRFCKDRKDMASYIVRKSKEFLERKEKENGMGIQSA